MLWLSFGGDVFQVGIVFFEGKKNCDLFNKQFEFQMNEFI